MKKNKKLLATILMIGILANAICLVGNASPRTVDVQPEIIFSGSKVICRVDILGNSTTDNISVVVKLYKNGYCTNMWSESGQGTLYFSEETTATKGTSYRMTVNATIKGVTHPTITVSKKYE